MTILVIGMMTAVFRVDVAVELLTIISFVSILLFCNELLLLVNDKDENVVGGGGGL